MKEKPTLWVKLQKVWEDFFQYNTDLIEEDPSFHAATQGADREEQYVGSRELKNQL